MIVCPKIIKQKISLYAFATALQSLLVTFRHSWLPYYKPKKNKITDGCTYMCVKDNIQSTCVCSATSALAGLQTQKKKSTQKKNFKLKKKIHSTCVCSATFGLAGLQTQKYMYTHKRIRCACTCVFFFLWRHIYVYTCIEICLDRCHTSKMVYPHIPTNTISIRLTWVCRPAVSRTNAQLTCEWEEIKCMGAEKKLSDFVCCIAMRDDFLCCIAMRNFAVLPRTNNSLMEFFALELVFGAHMHARYICEHVYILYIYIYAYIYIFIHIYVNSYIYIYTYMYVHIYTHLYTHIYIYIYIYRCM